MNAKEAREYTDEMKLLNIMNIIRNACCENNYNVQITPYITDSVLLDKLDKLKYKIYHEDGYTTINW